MSDLEQELRAMADLTAPPSTTALDDVLRRGRQRVFALRAGAAAGVVAVVAGAGFATVALRGAPAPLPLADGGPVVTTVATPPQQVWPKADLPARTPYGTWSPAASAPPGPGSEVLVTPLCDTHDSDLVGHLEHRPVPAEVTDALRKAIGLVAGLAEPSDLKTAVLRPGAPNADTFQWIDVTDAGGTGSLMIDKRRFDGEPLTAADRDAFPAGNCEPPNRMVKEDGTVLQVSSAVPSEPFQSLTQTLRIFHPGGDLVEITMRNYGSPDLRVTDDGTAFDRFGKGRPTLPLSTEQLMAIGEYLAHVG
jgi:hypothetical protein